MKDSSKALTIFSLFVLTGAFVFAGPGLFGKAGFIPFDTACWPPWSIDLTPSALSHLREGSNMDITEKSFLVEPDLMVAERELSRGEIPYWNPYVRNGAPLLHHSLDGLLYPPHWLLFVMPHGKAFALLAIISFMAAALFTFLLLRLWGLVPLAAAAGGLFFAFSGPMAANAHFYMRHDVLALLPAMLWAFERWRSLKGLKGGPALALVMAAIWLAGFPSFAVAFTWAVVIWALLASPSMLHRKRIKSLAGAGFFAVIGLILASPQLFPLFSYLPWSQRGVIPPSADLRTWGADPAALLGAFVPDLFGSPATSESVSYLHSPIKWLLFCWTGKGLGLVTKYNFTEFTIYAGALPLLLALCGLSRPWPGKRRPLLIFVIATLILSLGLDFGYVSNILPGLLKAGPLRLLPVFTFVVTLFSARGIHLLLKGTRPPAWVAVYGLLVTSVIGIAWIVVYKSSPHGFAQSLLSSFSQKYIGPEGKHFSPEYIEKVFLTEKILVASRENLLAALGGALGWWGAASVLIVLVRGAKRAFLVLAALSCMAIGMADLVNFGLPLCPSREGVDPFSGTAFHKALAMARDRASKEGGIYVARVNKSGSGPAMLFPPNLPAGMGIRDLQCYAFVDKRSHRPLAEAWKSVHGKGCNPFYPEEPWFGMLPDSSLLEHSILDLYGVTHLICKEKPVHGDGVLFRHSGPGGSIVLAKRKGNPARARVVASALPMDDDNTLKRMSSTDFDSGKVAFLPPGGKMISGKGGGVVEFLEDHPGSIRISVKKTGGGLLVISDTFTPGWSALVDGKEVEVERADYCFMGIPIQVGDHIVDLNLGAGPFTLGLFLSLLALAGLGIVLYYGRKRADSK